MRRPTGGARRSSRVEAARFEAPENVEAAVSLLAAEKEARILSGGTDLLVQMRLNGVVPGVFIDVKRIPRLNALSLDSTGLRVGAAVPAADIYANESIRQLWPGLAEATDLIGSSQIQGRATWAGNLCNASPAADSVPALIACDAKVVVAGPKGERTLPVEGFTTGPGSTVLAAGEFVVEFEVPVPPDHSSDAYLRLIPRSEMDIAVVGSAVQLALDGDGVVRSARVVLGAVAPTVIVVPEAAEALVGSRLEDEALAGASEAATAAANPIDDRRGTIAYRKKISGVLTRRAARIAYDRARAR
ncbi:MAG: xanthine dehydrogenase family protein subunit M [Deltaproteobacteria bacterium]|nr:xanthine dehydrogenase family protein subunit M [Deltaproteobacteria bacterium]